MALGLVCGLSAFPAAAYAPAFPAALDREALLGWLRLQTDIAPGEVLAVTPQALTAVVPAPSGANDGEPRLTVRAEALTPEAAARVGAFSWRVSMEVDCAGRRVKLGETAGYGARNLAGESRVLRAAEPDWRTPAVGAALESAWRSVCDPAFKRPFADARSAPEQAKAAGGPPQPRAPYAGIVVQVGAVTSQAEADVLLARLSGRIGEHPHWVERATVAGRVWRRALVGGFADTAEAARFCTQLKAAGGACFVRPVRRHSVPQSGVATPPP